jgi:hypothetical protein
MTAKNIKQKLDMQGELDKITIKERLNRVLSELNIASRKISKFHLIGICRTLNPF